MTHQHKYVFVCLLAIATLLSAASFQPALAQSLGAASSFSVLGNPVTCTTSVITGDVGVSPATAAFTNTGCTIVGGTPGGPPSGTDAAAANAHAALLSTYSTLNPINPINCGTTISTAAFTGNVLVLGPLPPGVYCFPNVAGLTFTNTTLTLDGSTNPTGTWIFEVANALTGTGFQVVMTNGGQACNVFWSVGTAASLTDSQVQGNILAGATGGAITIKGGILVGRALANGAVVLTSTNIQGSCALVDQAKAICSANDNDEHDRDKDKDKDHEKDKEHEKEKERERERDR
jgi:hypothetical protein